MASASEGGCLPMPPLGKKSGLPTPRALIKAPSTRRRMALLGWPPRQTAAPMITKTEGAAPAVSVTRPVAPSRNVIAAPVLLDNLSRRPLAVMLRGPIAELVGLSGVESEFHLSAG